MGPSWFAANLCSSGRGVKTLPRSIDVQRRRMDILERHKVWDGYLKVWRLRIGYADGVEVWRELEHHGDSVSMLPYDPVRRLALTVRLPRAPLIFLGETELLEEACAGMIDAGEAPETAARREAMEELGLRLGELELVGRSAMSPGVSAQHVTLFLAPWSVDDRVAAGGGAEGEHERIEVLQRPLADLARDADAGAIGDLCLYSLVMALRLRRPDLF
jgi:nudix-type nucleoside diphosphatase (YffH/AdpP family)